MPPINHNASWVMASELVVSDLPIRLHLAYQDLDRLQGEITNSPELWSDLLSAMRKVSRLERATFRPGPQLADALKYLGIPTLLHDLPLHNFKDTSLARILYKRLWRWQHEQHRIWRMKRFGLFQYKPLKDASDIRLVEIKKGEFSDMLECDLKYVSSKDNLRYEALSYTWGSADTPHEVACGEGYLQITQNLKAALLRLRLTYKSRLIWIDAMSINQKDENERNHQVKLMKRIFQQAEKVIIYLGDWTQDGVQGNTGGPHIPFDLARKYRTWQARRENDNPDKRLARRKSQPSVRPSSNSPFEDEHLFARQWFHRVWIVQEVASARSIEVLIGGFSTTWRCLVYIARHYTAIRPGALSGRHAIEYYGYGRSLGFDDAYKAAQHVLDIDNIRKAVQIGALPPLYRFLEPMFFTQSTDARDKVYALVNLTSDAQFLLEDAEYSLPVSDVFTRLVQFAVEIYNSLEILYFVGGERPGLPSWVPDFGAASVAHSATVLPWPAFRTMLQEYPRDTGPFPVATFKGQYSHPSGLPLKKGSRSIPMSIEGTVIGTISLLSTPLDLPHDLDGAETLARIRKDWNVLGLSTLNIKTDTSFKRFEPLAQVPHLPREELVPRLMIWLDKCSGNPSLSSQEYKQFVKQDTYVAAKRYREYLASQCRPLLAGRTLAATKSGHMLCVPAEASKSDLVCMLRGADVPFVLRPLEEGTYRLIGACYIETLSAGQWDWKDADMKEFLLL